MIQTCNKLKIFLIEDAASIRAILIDVLQQTGMIDVIGHAEAQVDALQQLRALEWDVAIVDISLREGNGLGVLAGLQGDARNYGQRVVFTASPSAELTTRSLALGACQLFDKASDMDQMVSFIRGVQDARPSANG